MPAQDLRHSPFDALLGTEWLSDDPDGARARVEVREELKQTLGRVHGGVYTTLVEAVCSRATALHVTENGNSAMGQSLEISFLRPGPNDRRRAARPDRLAAAQQPGYPP